MSNVSLQHFCNRIAEAGRITRADLRILAGEILPDGITSRDEADLLIALDRVVVDADDSFTAFLVAGIVDFAVWGERPTGFIDRAIAGWLAASLGAGAGPTATGARIAMEIVREAQNSDELLIAFALEANRWTRQPAGADRPAFARAA